MTVMTLTVVTKKMMARRRRKVGMVAMTIRMALKEVKMLRKMSANNSERRFRSLLKYWVAQKS